MIVFDLFETEQPPERAPVEDPRTATDQATKSQSLFIYQELVKAYKSGAPISTIDWTTPGVPVMTLSRNQIYTVLWNYAMAMKKGPKKKEEFARMFANRSDLFNYVGSLKKILKAPPAADIPTPTVGMPGEQGPVQATQGRLFKEAEKKSFEDPKFKSTRLDRLKTQARAKHPAAASDMEAMVADFVDQQDQDQAEFDRVKTVNRRQDELLKQITDLNQAQSQEIDNLEGEEARLQQNVKQIQAANAALAQKLAAMSQRRVKAEPEPAPQVGVSIATDKVASTPVSAEPAGVSVATDKQAQPSALPKPKRRRTAKPLDTAQPATVGGTSAEVLPKKQVRRKKGEQAPLDLNLPNGNGLPKNTTATDVGVDEVPGVTDNYDNLMSMLRGQGLQTVRESAIPLKKVFAGYTITFDPATKTVSAFRGLSGPQQGKSFKLNSATPGAYLRAVRQLLGDEVAEGSVFGQQDFDTQMDLAKLKSQLTQHKPAQSAPAEPQPVAYQSPARLSDLELRKQRVDNLADIKKTIEQLQARATRGGRELPPGLAADLEDYFTTADIDTDYDEMMSKYQRQLAALQKYLNLRRAVWAPKKETNEMRAKELEESLRGGESYSAQVYFKDGTVKTVTGIPSIETDLKQYFAKKGKPVERVKFNFAPQGSGRGTGPEPHEPGSGTARSAKTGEELPEDALDRSGQKMYQSKEVYMLTHNGQEVAFYTLKDLKRAEQDAQDMQRKLGGEVHLRKVMRETEQQPQDDVMKRLFKDFGDIFGKQPPEPKSQEPEKKEVKEMGRAGYNAMQTEKDWIEVERQLAQLINDRTLDPESRAEARQRYLEKRKEAQQKGWAK
jgi:hypothetical protein